MKNYIYGLSCLFLLVICSSGFAFEFELYQPADLDILRASQRVTSIVPVTPQKLRFKVSLASPAYACSTKILKIALSVNQVDQKAMEKLSLTRCVDVWTPRGAKVSMFVQDQLTSPMMQEIVPGGRMFVFCDYLFATPEGPGLLISEYVPASARE